MFSPRAHCLPGHIISRGTLSLGAHYLRGGLSPGNIVFEAYCLGGILSQGGLSLRWILSRAFCLRAILGPGRIVSGRFISGQIVLGYIVPGRLFHVTMSPKQSFEFLSVVKVIDNLPSVRVLLQVVLDLHTETACLHIQVPEEQSNSALR